MSLNGKTQSLNAQCQILWYKWDQEILPNDLSSSELLQTAGEAVGYDISNHLIENLTFTKNLGSSSGSFSFKLDASRDWRQEILPGHWCLIYLSNHGELSLPSEQGNGKLPLAPSDMVGFKKNLRGLCYIDRVSVTTNVEERGAIDVTYEISGRDFGAVYEDTTLWLNYFLYERGRVDALFGKLVNIVGKTLGDLLKLSHDLFFAPDNVLPVGALNDQKALTSIGRQWMLPSNIPQALGIDLQGKLSFFGNLVNLNFNPTKVTMLIENPLFLIEGTAWQKLKSIAISPDLHELFTEVNTDGIPTLTFRQIPFGVDQSGYQLVAASGIKKLIDLNESGNNVVISPENLISANLGRDEHSRYNHFLLTVSYVGTLLEDNISLLSGQSGNNGRIFPYGDKSSILRHGFKPMHSEVRAFPQASLKPNTPASGKIQAKLLKEYNELLYDIWSNAIYMDSGTCTKIGSIDVKLGEVAYFDPSLQQIGGKLFYIEGYVDDFSIDSNGTTSWTQSLQLTRGATIAQLKSAFKAQSLLLAAQGDKLTGDFTGK